MPDICSVREDSPVPGGEFAFTWSDFRQIAALVHGEAGIVLPESKANLVYSRLAKRLRAIGLRSFRDYCALIRTAEGIEERQCLIAAMTTNVTRFFREQHHFDHLESSVLPQLIAAARHGRRIRLWSAGCSSGEEPYSLALTLLNAMPDAGERDILILASDIDPDMLARAQDGRYPIERLGDIPTRLRSRQISVDSAYGTQQFSFSDTVRNLIRFRHLNLLKEWPIRGQFDVIFCRNVMIYFDQPTQEDIWTRFCGKLVPGGQLYIGHSERVTVPGLPLTLVTQTGYRRKEDRP
jgi:chemotaxis protein methyltransferase CheR